MKKLRMVMMALCLLQSAVFVAAEPPAENVYIPFSRVDAPAGKAYTYKTENGKDLQIEVYCPEGHHSAMKAVPGMIIFHGGGWTGGNVSEFRSLCHYFASRGLVTASVEYRLITKDQRRESSRFKRVCITDAKSAIRWFKQHASELGVDPKRIITGGGSAGGHVSLLATTTPGLNDPDDPMQFDTSVVAYILFNPALSGGDAIDDEVCFRKQLKADFPPSIVFFGSEDGWLKGWKRVQAQMKPLGIENSEFWMAEGENHGIFNQPGWSNISIIAADRFLNRLGLIEGEPTMATPDAKIKLTKAESQPGTPASPDQAAFEKASNRAWEEVLFDSFTQNWQKQWMLDGEVATAVNTPDGIELTAGPEFRNDAHHMVLWTKDEFKGDVKIEYEFTRLDSKSNCVNILYIEATGSGEGPYKKDIAEWADLRKVPAMKLYYDCMNTYHISYAVNEPSDDYIRGRRYMPHKTGLKGCELKPDYFKTGLFHTGVPHKLTVIKQDRDLFMRISTAEQTRYFHWHNDKLPPITEGRIGLRLMFTRSSRIRNFRVSVPDGVQR